MQYTEAIITTEGALFAQKLRDTERVLTGSASDVAFYREATSNTEPVTLQWSNAPSLRVEWVPDGTNALVNMMSVAEGREPEPLLVALLLRDGRDPAQSSSAAEFMQWQKDYAAQAERTFSKDLPQLISELDAAGPVLITLSAYWNLLERTSERYIDERFLSATANLFAAAFFEAGHQANG